jgi:hypothetical protein
MNNWLALIRFLGTRLAIYLSAVVVTYLLASITATQSVVSSLSGMGVALGFGERIAMTLQDISGMAGMFLPMVALGFLISFKISARICRYRGQWRFTLNIHSGATPQVCIHLALNLAFGITPVAIARTTGGLLLQAVAGAAGGLTYVLLSRKFQLVLKNLD